MTLNCNQCHHPIQAIGKIRENSAICMPCYIEELTTRIFDLESALKQIRELHPSIMRNEYNPSKDDMVCETCEVKTDNGSTLFVREPCPTKQVIDKILGNQP